MSTTSPAAAPGVEAAAAPEYPVVDQVEVEFQLPDCLEKYTAALDDPAVSISTVNASKARFTLWRLVNFINVMLFVFVIVL